MRAWLGLVAVVAVGCGKSTPRVEVDSGAGGGSATTTPSATTTAPPTTSGEADASSDAAPASGAASTDAGASPCPDDMAYVHTSFCPDIQRQCLDMEHEEKNHLEICHAFSHQQSCRVEEHELDVCVDRYEYPNKKGGHPVWMLDWSQAQATCESKGKRLCTGNEWTAACEGPEHLPYPYGWERDHDKCNMDSYFIDPRKPAPKAQFLFYSKDPAIAFKELSRLDQSVPSGSMETCRSGFGVYDLPGNVDEWVLNDGPPREKSRYAGLKGGAWGHVRSQCRPETFSHDPEFTYYFVGFRCCQDAQGAPASSKWAPSPQAVPPPAVEAHDFAPDPIVPVDAPGPSKTKYARMGHRE
jgi:formylglycine-generating enzyme